MYETTFRIKCLSQQARQEQDDFGEAVHHERGRDHGKHQRRHFLDEPLQLDAADVAGNEQAEPYGRRVVADRQRDDHDDAEEQRVDLQAEQDRVEDGRQQHHRR